MGSNPMRGTSLKEGLFMSSLIRRIQLAPQRGRYYYGRGSKLGVRNPKAKDLLARKSREDRKMSTETI